MMSHSQYMIQTKQKAKALEVLEKHKDREERKLQTHTVMRYGNATFLVHPMNVNKRLNDGLEIVRTPPLAKTHYLVKGRYEMRYMSAEEVATMDKRKWRVVAKPERINDKKTA